METLQKQILTLSNKVEAIYAVIERLDMKLSQVLPNSSDHTVIVPDSLPDIIDDNLPSPEIPLYDLDQDEFIGTKWEHKDILNDVLYSEINYQIGDQQITPEIQIQRLTAQLTAAYHRIAALEDQLLQQRVY
ncbi:hypothetical protein H6F32_17840 [Anabaena sp. FACHB-1237]|uniref:hypothetical protein n=1 Tax=Anabaena sp. FACHB-1237 TaxID=2692769 RepID=UPI001681962D|nr:hypothetical protein [Anabaena sp. FACHB-1237]MBD2139383.1 hypothetical protein [Anabaena sp. FACHB-1237]